jgi:hypothetical protein
MNNRTDYIKEKIGLWKMMLGGCLAVIGSLLVRFNEAKLWSICLLIIIIPFTDYIWQKTTDLIELLNHDSGDIIP